MKWFALLIPWAVFNIIAYLGAPILALFAVDRLGPIDNNNGTDIEPRLPLWLAWFDSYDNSLLGDGAWKRMEAGHWEWRANYSGWLQQYLGRVGWLLRNPAYGFERAILAAKIKPTDIVDVFGDPCIQDKPVGREGSCYTEVGDYWAFDFVRRIGDTRCIKINLGWKLKTYAEDPTRVATQSIAQYVVSPRLTTFVPSSSIPGGVTK
jgi:hypothetical protein